MAKKKFVKVGQSAPHDSYEDFELRVLYYETEDNRGNEAAVVVRWGLEKYVDQKIIAFSGAKDSLYYYRVPQRMTKKEIKETAETILDLLRAGGAHVASDVKGEW